MEGLNKYFRGAIPALLLHLSVGSVYAWSLFVTPLNEYMGIDATKIQFAFSLAIFFLGMSAAFGGKLVEKNVHLSSYIGMICFISGLLISALGVYLKSLIVLYLGYGVIGGIGLGVTYLTPCKTLMAWFPKQKGLAMGISIMGFGFGSAVASPMINSFMNTYGKDRIYMVFLTLAGIYFVAMFIGCLLLKKPKEYEEADKNNTEKFDYLAVIKNKSFVLMWFMFYLNIHCGLSLIGVASPMLSSYGAASSVCALVVLIMGIFNGLGRLVLSTISDTLKNRSDIYLWIFGVSIVTAVLCGIIKNNILVIAIGLCIISALYGAGFSNIAPLLADKFGMKNISKIHGMILSAWAIAGLTGNTAGSLIYKYTNDYGKIFIVGSVLYLIALLCVSVVKKDKQQYEN